MIKNLLKSIYYLFHPKRQLLFLEYTTKFSPRYTTNKPHPELYKLISKWDNSYSETLNDISQRENVLSISKEQKSESEPFWNNEYFPGLDVLSLNYFLAKYRPERYVEIGSGMSTRVARKSIVDHKLDTEIICIDPAPRQSIKEIGDKIHYDRLENNVDLVLDQVKAGDILFIDNSHRILPNSDSNVFFLEILPRLPVGTIVHIHDIYLPYDYPQFMCDRFYSEQYALASYVLHAQDKYEILFPCFYISENKELASKLEPLWNKLPDSVEKHGGSFWFITK